MPRTKAARTAEMVDKARVFLHRCCGDDPTPAAEVLGLAAALLTEGYKRGEVKVTELVSFGLKAHSGELLPRVAVAPAALKEPGRILAAVKEAS